MLWMKRSIIGNNVFVCNRKNCGLYNDELKNHCDALATVGTDTRRCSFFKTEKQIKAEQAKIKERIKKDENFAEAYNFYKNKKSKKQFQIVGVGVCPVCGKEFQIPSVAKNKTFCSRSCYEMYRRSESKKNSNGRKNNAEIQ